MFDDNRTKCKHATNCYSSNIKFSKVLKLRDDIIIGLSSRLDCAEVQSAETLIRGAHVHSPWRPSDRQGAAGADASERREERDVRPASAPPAHHPSNSIRSATPATQCPPSPHPLRPLRLNPRNNVCGSTATCTAPSVALSLRLYSMTSGDLSLSLSIFVLSSLLLLTSTHGCLVALPPGTFSSLSYCRLPSPPFPTPSPLQVYSPSPRLSDFIFHSSSHLPLQCLRSLQPHPRLPPSCEESNTRTYPPHNQRPSIPFHSLLCPRGLHQVQRFLMSK